MNAPQASPDIVAELLEIAIHNILYSRKIYPEGAFQKSRKYNIPVQVAVHPQVVDYIDSCVMTVHKLLQRNELRKMVLHIVDSSHRPMEQFVFEVSFLSRVPALGGSVSLRRTRTCWMWRLQQGPSASRSPRPTRSCRTTQRAAHSAFNCTLLKAQP